MLSIEQLLILLLLSCTLCQAWQRNRLISPSLSVWKKWSIKSISIGAAGVLLGWGLPACLDSVSSLPQFGSAAVVVHADSTGKFSTKLTAKRRYLPRIEQGRKTFNELLATKPADRVAISSFISNDLDKLEKAMILYGDSLRRGELPDEISRNAEGLAHTFAQSLRQINQNSDLDASLKEAKLAFDNYLAFVKI
eukprot:scaffold3994_cov179-Ochromonas_danica.AAC.1